MATRSQSTTPEQQEVRQFSANNATGIQDIIDVTILNLHFIEGFILKSKDALNQRQEFQNAVHNIRLAVQHLPKIEALNSSSPNNGVPNLEDKLKQIVENVLDEKLKNNPVTNAPSYSQIAAKISSQPPPKQNRPTYKVIVKPNASLNLKTADETRKLLTSKSPKEYGINVDKITPLKNNAILIESRCDSILNLPDNEKIRKMKLVAERVNKVWPKLQIFDVPKNTTSDELIKEIYKQEGIPNSVPEKFVKNAFKVGQTRNDTNTWVIEIHPAARAHFMKTAKIYIQWKSLNIKDYIRVTRCYNCQKYGHVSKHCKSEKQCGFCASTAHESKDCSERENSSKHKCANCVRGKQQDANHHSGSSECPIYKTRLQDLINNTNYG
jgi:hypothetical protein